MTPADLKRERSGRLLARLDAAHAGSQQRTLGSNVFGEAATAIRALQARVDELERDAEQISVSTDPDGDMALDFLADVGMLGLSVNKNRIAWACNVGGIKSHGTIHDALALHLHAIIVAIVSKQARASPPNRASATVDLGTVEPGWTTTARVEMPHPLGRRDWLRLDVDPAQPIKLFARIAGEQQVEVSWRNDTDKPFHFPSLKVTVTATTRSSKGA